MAGYDSDHSTEENSTNINTTTNHSTTHHQNQNTTTPNSNNSMAGGGAASPNHSNQIDQKPYITNNNNLTNSSLLHSSSSIAPSASAAVIPGQTSLSSHFSHYSSHVPSAYPNVTTSTGGLHNTTSSSTPGILSNPVSTSSYSHQPSSVAQHSAPHHMSYMGYSSLDVKPSHLADWYSHAGMTSMAMHGMAAPGMTTATGRYDSNPHAGKVPYHVAAALPTPPSTGHSPIQSLSNHLNLLPATTSAVAYT